MQKIGDTLKAFEMPKNDFEGIETTNALQMDDKSQTDAKELQIKYILEALPPRFSKVTPNFDTYNELKQSKQSLIFTGPVGTGKTHKMFEILVPYLAENYISVFYEPRQIKPETIQKHFFSVSEALRRIRQSFDQKTDMDVADWMIKTPMLFLDDLGTEKISDWTREIFFNVINERYNWMRPIVMSSNLTFKEIAQHYGDRMASRLYEMAKVEKISGDDRRLKGSK
jgi:DNA replication protein DnaC